MTVGLAALAFPPPFPPPLDPAQSNPSSPALHAALALALPGGLCHRSEPAPCLPSQAHGPPAPENIYLINGDVADRGGYAVEIYLLLFACVPPPRCPPVPCNSLPLPAAAPPHRRTTGLADASPAERRIDVARPPARWQLHARLPWLRADQPWQP